MVRLHRDKLHALEPDTELTRQLAGSVENRRRLVDERTRLVNQIHATLKTYYPLAESWLAGQLTKPFAADFLVRWPDLEGLQKTNLKTLRAFFYEHNGRNAQKIEERFSALQNAKPLTSDPAIILPARTLVSALASMLQPLHRAIAQLDEQIQAVMDQHPEAPIFRSFPGAGPTLAPRLLVAFGTQRSRFAHSRQIAQFYGLAPVVVQSGNSKTTHMRFRCPKFGRQSFHENAACALRKEPWAKAYYDQQMARHGGKHHQACRALAFKLIRIYFACWKESLPYNSERYLQALQKHGSPLPRLLLQPSAQTGE